MTIDVVERDPHPRHLTTHRQQSGWAGHVGYPDSCLTADLARVADSWRRAQRHREREAIFQFLTNVFELVAWWAFENKANERAARALALKKITRRHGREPYAAVILASVSPSIVDKRSISKWSRALRFAAAFKPRKKRLTQFIRGQGGINACAAGYSARLSRRGRRSQTNLS